MDTTPTLHRITDPQRLRSHATSPDGLEPLGYTDLVGSEEHWITLSPHDTVQRTLLHDAVCEAQAALQAAQTAYETWIADRMARDYAQVVAQATSPRASLAVAAQRWAERYHAIQTLGAGWDDRPTWQTAFSENDDVALDGHLSDDPSGTLHYRLTLTAYWSETINHAGAWDGQLDSAAYQALVATARHTLEPAILTKVQRIRRLWEPFAPRATWIVSAHTYASDKGISGEGCLQLTWTVTEIPTIVNEIDAFVRQLDPR